MEWDSLHDLSINLLTMSVLSVCAADCCGWILYADDLIEIKDPRVQWTIFQVQVAPCRWPSPLLPRLHHPHLPRLRHLLHHHHLLLERCLHRHHPPERPCQTWMVSNLESCACTLRVLFVLPGPLSLSCESVISAPLCCFVSLAAVSRCVFRCVSNL